MLNKSSVITAVALAATALAGLVATRFAFFVVPFAWTGEPPRLADALGVRPGSRVADIGAGDGSLAVEMGRLVGPNGTVYATELDPERRQAIAARVDRAALSNVRLVEAGKTVTNLPPGCCGAVYLRMVFHHLADRPAFAREVVKAVQPGGRVAVIDFAPGGLWFHGRDHGVGPEAVVAALEGAGCTLLRRDDHWGGGTFLLLFECGERFVLRTARSTPGPG